MHSEAGRQGQSAEAHDEAAGSGLSVGTVVCVWNYYLQKWSAGFEVAEALPLGYRLRRLSDGQLVDHVFTGEEVMVERRREQLPGFDGPPLDRRAPGEAPTTD